MRKAPDPVGLAHGAGEAVAFIGGETTVQRYVFKQKKAASHRLLHVFSLLLDVVRAKRSRVVKARDLRIIFGIDDHGVLTAMGHLLNWLVRNGYAEKLNKQSPVRYRLKEIIPWIAKNCKQQCKTCKMTKTCPYRKLRTLVQGENNG